MQWTPAKKFCHEKLLVCSQHSKSLDIKGFPLQKKKNPTKSIFTFYLMNGNKGCCLSVMRYHDHTRCMLDISIITTYQIELDTCKLVP